MKIVNKKFILSMSLFFMTSFLFLNCGKKKDSATTKPNTETETETATDTGNTEDPASGPSTLALGSGINTAVPANMAVSSITQPLSQEAMQARQILINSLRLEAPQPADANDYKSKVERTKKVLTTTNISECIDAMPNEFNLNQGIFGHAQCSSAARINITDHPDNSLVPPASPITSFGGGDLGLWWDYGDIDATSGQACSASVINAAMTSVAAYSDAAMGMHAMVACAGRLKEVTLPENVGDNKDMLDTLTEIDTSAKSFTVSAATISREADTSEGQKVYLTSLTGTLKDVPRNIETDYRLRVRHVPTADDNSTYFGVIQFEIDKLDNAKDPGIISISYTSDGTGIKYRYRQAKAPTIIAAGFDTTSYEISNSIESRITEVITDIDENGFGKLILAWATVSGMVFNAETKTDGTGVAYFGNTPNSAEKTPDFYQIQGFRCLPLSPYPTDKTEFMPYVQKQTLEVDTTSGAWNLATSKIKYAPTTTCDWNTDNDPGQTAVFTITNQDVASYNETMGFPYDHVLEDLADYTANWTGPTAPSNQF